MKPKLWPCWIYLKRRPKKCERTSPRPLETLHRCCIFTAYNMDLDAFRIFSALDFALKKISSGIRMKNIINFTIVFCSFWAPGKCAMLPVFCKFWFGILICSSWTFTDECMLEGFCLYNTVIFVKRRANLCMCRNTSVSEEKLLPCASGTCSLLNQNKAYLTQSWCKY